MALKTRKRSLRGGKYVGEGSYGCGYSPAIRCKGQAVRPPGMFSKVMNKNDAEEEQAIGKWFQKVDPLQKYFIYSKKYCVLHADMLEMPENNMKPCKKAKYTTYNIKNARMLQYINGGEALTKLILGADDYIPFFKSIPQLLEGLVLLHSKNIAHMDIKNDNTVFLKNSSSMYNIRYIDFGLSINIEEVMMGKYIDDRVYKNNYFAWPYDTRFMVDRFSKKEITKKSIDDGFVDDHSFGSFPFPFEIYYSNPSTLHITEDTYKEIWDDIKTSIGGDKNVWKAYLSKATDVYSLGRLLSKLYTKYVGHFYRFGATTVFNAGRTVKIELASLPTLVTPDVWQWHKDVSREITKPFNALVLKMMDIHPLRRISAAAALTEYNLLLEKFQAYFKPDLVAKALDLTPGLGVAPMYSTSTTTTTTATAAPATAAPATAAPFVSAPVVTGLGLGAGAGFGPIVPVSALPVVPLMRSFARPPPAPLAPTAPAAPVAMPRINEDPFPHEKLRVLRALEKKQNRGEELTDAEEAELEIAKVLINAWEEAYNKNTTRGGRRNQRTRKVKRS